MKTERIGLATGVTCPSVRYHPAIIAQAATLALPVIAVAASGPESVNRSACSPRPHPQRGNSHNLPVGDTHGGLLTPRLRAAHR